MPGLQVMIFGGDVVVWEAGDCFEPCGSHRFFERCGAAPFPVRSRGHEFVMHGVLMDVVESGEVALLMSQMGFPEVLPEPGAAGVIVAAVEFAGGQAVEFPDHLAE